MLSWCDWAKQKQTFFFSYFSHFIRHGILLWIFHTFLPAYVYLASWFRDVCFWQRIEVYESITKSHMNKSAKKKNFFRKVCFCPVIFFTLSRLLLLYSPFAIVICLMLWLNSSVSWQASSLTFFLVEDGRNSFLYYSQKYNCTDLLNAARIKSGLVFFRSTRLIFHRWFLELVDDEKRKKHKNPKRLESLPSLIKNNFSQCSTRFLLFICQILPSLGLSISISHPSFSSSQNHSYSNRKSTELTDVCILKRIELKIIRVCLRALTKSIVTLTS